MNKTGIKGQRLAALFLLAFMLFNYPILSLFGARDFVFGVPALFAWLFLVWALLIAAMALIVERPQ